MIILDCNIIVRANRIELAPWTGARADSQTTVSPIPFPRPQKNWLRSPHFTAIAMGEEDLELKFLSHGAEDVFIASIIRLSSSVFGPLPEPRYTSLEEWKERLSDPSSSIVYLVPQSDKSPASSGDDHSPVPPPVAFLFAYPRSHPEPLKNGTYQSLHIWLAGVLEEYRGRGCLGTMVNALVDRERKRLGLDPSSTPMMTVCTSLSRFPLMWAWLRARTWWVLEKEFDGGKVMFSLTGRYYIQ